MMERSSAKSDTMKKHDAETLAFHVHELQQQYMLDTLSCAGHVKDTEWPGHP